MIVKELSDLMLLKGVDAVMYSVFTLQKMIEEAIKRDEELIHCIDEGYNYTIQDLLKALQISLDCLKVYQKINDEAVKECDV